MNSRCPICPNTHRQVMPCGPTTARIMLIGEGPGRQEDARGVPFVGLSGQELDQTYLRLAGLRRDDLFITNVVQCRCERGGQDVKPGKELMAACGRNHLDAEIRQVQPEIFILCGSTACEYFGITDSLELCHGKPQRWSGVTMWPMYHPAAGMHQTRFMTPMIEDWERLGKWLAEEWDAEEYAEDKHEYELLHGELNGLWPTLAIDTESDEGRPFSIQWSGYPGRGYMLLASDWRGMGKFQAWVTEDKPQFVIHNAAYDLKVLGELGITGFSYRDTMQEIYHLGNLPQGLKAAVYRVFGYRMKSYDETVVPHSRRVLEGWLAEAMSLDLAETVVHPVGPCEICQVKHRLEKIERKAHKSEAVLRRILNKLSEEGDGYNPWLEPKWEKGREKFRLIGQPWLAEIEAQIGRMPRQSIIHVPLEEAVEYGCSDADWTLRLAKWLDGERKRIVQEEWNVA